MKLLVIADTYPSKENPVACIFIKEQVGILRKKHNVRVLVIGRRFVKLSLFHLVKYLLRTVSGIVEKSGKEKTQINLTQSGKNREGILRIEYPVFSFFGFPIHILNGISIYLTVLTAFKKMDYRADLIYAHKCFPAGYAAWRLKRKFNIPVVTMEFQGPFSSYFDEPYRGKRVIATINNIDRTIYTRMQLAAIEAQGGRSERLGFAHFGVDMDRFTLDQEAYESRANENRKGRFKLLVVSRIEEAKGIRHIIGAIEKIKKEFLGVSMTIVGPLERGGKKILDLIETLNLRDTILYRGICANEELPSLIHEHDILVSASLYETFGITLIEAMACGKPVVATKCGGPEETVNKIVGVLVEKSNAQALADGIKYVIENHERYDPEEIRAYAVQNFSQDVAIERLEKIFEEVLSEK